MSIDKETYLYALLTKKIVLFSPPPTCRYHPQVSEGNINDMTNHLNIELVLKQIKMSIHLSTENIFNCQGSI